MASYNILEETEWTPPAGNALELELPHTQIREKLDEEGNPIDHKFLLSCVFKVGSGYQIKKNSNGDWDTSGIVLNNTSFTNSSLWTSTSCEPTREHLFKFDLEASERTSEICYYTQIEITHDPDTPEDLAYDKTKVTFELSGGGDHEHCTKGKLILAFGGY